MAPQVRQVWQMPDHFLHWFGIAGLLFGFLIIILLIYRFSLLKKHNYRELHLQSVLYDKGYVPTKFFFLQFTINFFLTALVTSANSETCFSALHCFKSYLWSTMDQERLNSLLIYIHRFLTREGKTTVFGDFK